MPVKARLTPGEIDCRAHPEGVAGRGAHPRFLRVARRSLLVLSRVGGHRGRFDAHPRPACDPLVVNEHEAALLLGGQLADDCATTARQLPELGPRSVVITLGAKGALCFDGSGATFVPAPDIKPVDTTGAGDAFNGAPVARMADGDELPAATRHAARAGNTAVLKRDARTSYPTADEVLAETQA